MQIIVKKVPNKKAWWCNYNGFRIYVKYASNRYKATVYSKKYKPWKCEALTLDTVFQMCIHSISQP